MTDFATRLNNLEDTAQRMRRSDALRATPTSGLGSVAGVRPGGGAISLVASSMRYKLTTFAADVPSVSGDGTSRPFVHDDATTEYTLLDGDPVGNRIDLVCARVREDAFDSSGFTDATIFAVKGNPATHVAPSVPDGCTPLWEVNVSSTASAGTGGVSIGTDRRLPAVAAGGIAPLFDASIGSGLYEGQAVYNKTDNQLELWDGSLWVPVQNVEDTGWQTDASNIVMAAAWTLTSIRIRNLNGAISVLITAVRAGSAISPDSKGDFENSTIVTLAADWIPSALQGLHSGGSGRVATGSVNLDGVIAVAAVAGTANIATGDTIQIAGMYFK